MLHVLPDGFRRICHFGFLADAHRSAKLAVIRGLLKVPEPVRAPEPVDYHERYARLFGRSLGICPACGGHLVEIAVLKPPACVSTRLAPATSSSRAAVQIIRQRRRPPHCGAGR